MALTVVWEKAAVAMEDGTEKILNRGDTLPDKGVSDYQRQVLTMIGAVRDLGYAVQVVQAEVDRIEQGFEEPLPPPVLPPEVPPVQPTNPLANEDPKATEPAGTGTGGTPLPKPSVSDNKDAWEAYAVQREYFTRAEAEAMTKTKLVAEVNKRESA
jgi:hypothetical protein